MSKSKNPCGVCNKGIRTSAVLCHGKCNLWYHKKCKNMPDVGFKLIRNGEVKSWKCIACTTNSKTLNIEQLKEKIVYVQLEDEDNLEKSLTIAAEAGNLLLEENEKLKQEIHDLKCIKSTDQLKLEDSIKAIEEELLNQKEAFLSKENDTQHQLMRVSQSLKIEKSRYDKGMMEMEKKNFNSRRKKMS